MKIYQYKFEIRLEKCKSPVIVIFYSNGGFLFKEIECCDNRQRIGYKDSEWTMSGVLCVIFLSWHWSFQSNLFFQSKILSAMFISEFFICFSTLVTNRIPLRKKFSNRAWSIYPLPTLCFPLISFNNLPCFNGFRSSTFLGVNMKLMISPLQLIIRYSLNPKNHPMKLFHARQFLQMTYESGFYCYDIHAREWNW